MRIGKFTIPPLVRLVRRVDSDKRAIIIWQANILLKNEIKNFVGLVSNWLKEIQSIVIGQSIVHARSSRICRSKFPCLWTTMSTLRNRFEYQSLHFLGEFRTVRNECTSHCRFPNTMAATNNQSEEFEAPEDGEKSHLIMIVSRLESSIRDCEAFLKDIERRLESPPGVPLSSLPDIQRSSEYNIGPSGAFDVINQGLSFRKLSVLDKTRCTTSVESNSEILQISDIPCSSRTPLIVSTKTSSKPPKKICGACGLPERQRRGRHPDGPFCART